MYPETRSGSVWPSPLGAYDYTQHLGRSQWSWEFVRRNAGYIRDWRVDRAGAPSATPLSSSARLIRLRRSFRRAEAWGLCFFVDPRQTALEADVFWHPEAYERVLTTVIGRQHMPGFNSPISLASLRCDKSILVTANDEKHLILRDWRYVLQLLCTGENVALDPGAMAFLVGELPNVEPEIRLLRRFAAIYRQRKPAGRHAGWSPRSIRLRNALIALDGSIYGASHRDIAEAIHGPEFVADNWGKGQRYLKDQVIRLQRKGRNFMEGGYRDLLR